MRFRAPLAACGLVVSLLLSPSCAAARLALRSSPLDSRGIHATSASAKSGAGIRLALFPAPDEAEAHGWARSSALRPVIAETGAADPPGPKRGPTQPLRRRDVPEAKSEDRRAAEFMYMLMSAEERKKANVKNAQDVSSFYEVPIEIARCYVAEIFPIIGETLPNYSREQKDEIGSRCEQKHGGLVSGVPYSDYRAWYRSVSDAERGEMRARLIRVLEDTGEPRALAECYSKLIYPLADDPPKQGLFTSRVLLRKCELEASKRQRPWWCLITPWWCQDQNPRPSPR